MLLDEREPDSQEHEIVWRNPDQGLEVRPSGIVELPSEVRVLRDLHVSSKASRKAEGVIEVAYAKDEAPDVSREFEIDLTDLTSLAGSKAL
jgi:hypothetical protein